MQRVYLSLLFLLCAGSMWTGSVALFAAIIIGIIMLVVVLPIFMVLREAKRLAWWHVVLAGTLVTVVVGIAAAGGGGARNGLGVIAAFVALGILVSSVFWWIAVFRNDAFDFVSRKPPYSMLLLMPLVIAALQYSTATRVKDGPIVCVEAQRVRERPFPSEYAELDIRLPNREIAKVTITQGYASENWVGRCIRTRQHATASLQGVRYMLGGSVRNDECTLPCKPAD